MFFVKAILIAALLICGAFFLAMGLGVPIPHVAYKGLVIRDAPIGLVFVIAGIALARLWPISQDSSYKETSGTGPGRIVKEWKRSNKFLVK
jgi:hypothetical protein